MIRARRVFAALCAALGVCAACESGGGAGGETHWLGDCNGDADCGGGRCLCGVCTRVCGGDADCAGSARSAACFETASPGLLERCAGTTSNHAPGICLATCGRDADCPSGETCLLGACVAGAHEAGALPARDASAPTPGETATHYVHVDAGATFGRPVEAPEPRLLVEGADGLVGTWAQWNSDGTRCTADHYDDPRDDSAPAVCAQLELGRDTTLGGITGRIHYLVRNPLKNPELAGPFAPAKDPSIGYPTGLKPVTYRDLRADIGDVDYRVFDGVFDGTKLSFWHSPLDLWTDWCALQTPYPFMADGVSGDRCVPPGASMENTDLSKLVLCTSAYDFGVCHVAGGVVQPCICLQDGGSEALLCRNAPACTCTAEHCISNLRALVGQVELDVSGETMKDPIPPRFEGDFRLELRKVSP